MSEPTKRQLPEIATASHPAGVPYPPGDHFLKCFYDIAMKHGFECLKFGESWGDKKTARLRAPDGREFEVRFRWGNPPPLMEEELLQELASL